MAEYLITLHGCDDHTLFRAELTSEQAAVVRRLAEVSRAVSTSDCQPTLHIDSFDIDKVVSINDRKLSSSAVASATSGDLACVGHPRRVGGDADTGDRGLGRGRRLRAEPVANAVSALAGEDRTRRS